MNNIKVLYYNARENNTAEDIQKYTEAVNQLTSKPDDYALQLEYIISSDIGLSTFKPFVEKNGLSIALLNDASNILESTIEKFEERNIKCNAWTETLDWLNQFREENINAVKMFEYYNDNNNDKYLKTYYGSTNGRPNRLLVKGMIDKFGESAIPDLFINAKSINEDTVDKIMEYAANYDSTPLFYEYLNSLTEKDYPMISEGCASSIVGKMKDKHDKAYKESLLLNEEGFYNYTESEIDAIQDLITFKEFQVLYDADNAESIGEEIDALYEEFEGLVIDEEYVESLQMEETSNEENNEVDLMFENFQYLLFRDSIFESFIDELDTYDIFDESKKDGSKSNKYDKYYPYTNGEENTHKRNNSERLDEYRNLKDSFTITDEKIDRFYKNFNGDKDKRIIIVEGLPLHVTIEKTDSSSIEMNKEATYKILENLYEDPMCVKKLIDHMFDPEAPLYELTINHVDINANFEIQQGTVYHEVGHALMHQFLKDILFSKNSVYRNAKRMAKCDKNLKNQFKKIEEILSNHIILRKLTSEEKKLRKQFIDYMKSNDLYEGIHGTPEDEAEADMFMKKYLGEEIAKKVIIDIIESSKREAEFEIKKKFYGYFKSKKYRSKVEKKLRPEFERLKAHNPKDANSDVTFNKFVDNYINSKLNKVYKKNKKEIEKINKKIIKEIESDPDMQKRLKLIIDEKFAEIASYGNLKKESATTNEDVADNVLGMLPQSRPDKVIRYFNIRDLMEAPWMYNTTNKKTGEVPDYLKRNHDMATYGEKEPEKPKDKPAPIEDTSTPEPENNNDEIKPYDGDTTQDTSLDDLRRPSAPKPEEPEEDNKPGPVKKSDDLREPKDSTQNGINNYYYYTYQNSLNRNSNSFNKDHSTHSDYHSNTNTNSFNGNKENDPTRDISPYHALESAFDLDPMNMFNEDVGDADDHRPESDHPIRDTFQDIDRASQKYWQKAKKGAQTVGNVGRAAYRPIRRGKEQLQAGMQKIHDKRENSAKENLADPHARKSIFAKIQKSLVAGSLWKAGLLLNPIFVFYFGYSRFRNKKDRARLRNELMGELQTEMKILDDKIERAKIADPEESYKLTRYKNELQKKFLRVAGDKAWQKAI